MAVILSKRQRAICRGTIHEAKRRYGTGWDAKKAACIAVMTMKTESGCRVLANANVPESIKLPHDLLGWSYDGLGHDHASIGSYQQQTGTAWTVPKSATTMGSPNGWGTPAELMDPPTAAGKFFDAMDTNVPDWRTKNSWVVAQDVQGSAFQGYPTANNNWSSVYGGNYKSQRAAAIGIVGLLWLGVRPTKPTPIPPPPKPAPKPPTQTSSKKVYIRVRPGDTLSSIAAHWNTTWQHLQQINGIPDPDRIQIGQKVRVK